MTRVDNRDPNHAVRAIGSSQIRADVRPLLAGRGSYIDDVAVAGLSHVAFLRSPYAHAEIRDIRYGDAISLSGVLHVVTARDLAPICNSWGSSLTYPGIVERRQTALAAETVSYQGQPVVAVVAETRAIAEDALDLIEVDWHELVPSVDLARSLDSNTVRAHSDLASNLAYSSELGNGVDERTFGSAAHVVEETFHFHRLTGAPMEPRGVIAVYVPDDETLTVHQSHTAPHLLRSLYAMHLNLDEGRVRVQCPNVGGSFGIKIHLYPDEIATCAISKLIGRPVKFVADRLESFVSDVHAREQIVRARVAADANGKLLAFDIDTLLGIGPFTNHPASSIQEGDETVRLAAAAYQVPAFRGRVRAAFQNKPITGQYRGVGHPLACAVTEFMMDKLADKLKLAPEAIRSRNFIPDDAYPLKSVTGLDLDALSHEKCLSKLLALIDMPRLRSEQARLRTQGIYRGIGLCVFVERTATGAPTNAHLRKATTQDGVTLNLDPSGHVRCAISVTEQGQGTHTVIAQVIAGQMGVPFDHVSVVSGDSAATPYGSGIRASRGAAVGGELALQAARNLRTNVLECAATLLQARSDELMIQNAHVRRKDRPEAGMSVKELCEMVHYRPQLLGGDRQHQLSVSLHLGHDWPSVVPTNGIHASHVEVDTGTGIVRLLNHWVVDDFGTIINPRLVEEQVRGGIAQGIGQALFEELIYSDEGQLGNASFAEYLLPKAPDLPDIVIDNVVTPWPRTELGAKGAGEAGTTGSLGAVLNAVNDALRPLNASIVDVPMTPARILRALGQI